MDIPYPGFEGRPLAPNRAAFFADVGTSVTKQNHASRIDLIYATGIGGLIVLELLADGKLPAVPIVFQGPVLWGLEHRLMPRTMRLAPIRAAAIRLFRTQAFRSRFCRKYFVQPVSQDFATRFFRGYEECAAFGQFFEWFTPARLESLARKLSSNADVLNRIAIWRGDKDRVVGRDEIRWTEQALKCRFPLRTFPHWGHYPMIDGPQDWVDALERAASE